MHDHLAGRSADHGREGVHLVRPVARVRRAGRAHLCLLRAGAAAPADGRPDTSLEGEAPLAPPRHQDGAHRHRRLHRQLAALLGLPGRAHVRRRPLHAAALEHTAVPGDHSHELRQQHVEPAALRIPQRQLPQEFHQGVRVRHQGRGERLATRRPQRLPRTTQVDARHHRPHRHQGARAAGGRVARSHRVSAHGDDERQHERWRHHRRLP